VMGTHSSALPERTRHEEPYTYVCQGEGPLTVLRLVEELRRSRLEPKLENVPGLTYKQAGQITTTLPAAKLKDLDKELPAQAWELLDMSLYRAHNWHCFDHIDQRQPYASLQTSLGCPYRCTFCCINAPFGGAGIRFWSPENIIGQIDTLVNKYGVKNIKIPDELFVLNRPHVTGICEKIIERGYDLNIWCYARVDTIQDDFLEIMRRAGIRWLGVGIESANKEVRQDVQKGRFEDVDIKAVVNRVRSQGFYVAANYIFGLPEDDYASMQQTLDMAIDLNTEWANFYSAMAYPGSQLYKMAVDGQWALPDSWLGFSQHAYETLPLPTKHLTGPEVLAFRDQAFGKYFANPAYMQMIGDKFGQPVVEHLRFMLGHKLERKYKPVVNEQRRPTEQSV
jgi:anaerobic magnesium-protoporphyrin IX monomethyl ester cyclase